MSDPTEARFSILLPIPVTDATLTSTNVPEVAAAAEYAGGTTYALGKIAGVTTGTVQAVYESLQAANTGHAPASNPTWWRFVGNAAAEYNAGTTYAADAVIGTTSGLTQTVYRSLQAGNVGHAQASSPTWWELVNTVPATFDLTVTYAQADYVQYINTDVHKLYKSATAGNVGQSLLDTSKWTDYGTTNSRAMFDSVFGSQTTNYNKIKFTITPDGLFNSAWLANLDAASVQIEQPSSGFDETVVLNNHDCLNWYDFYFKPVTRRSLASFVDMIPPMPASPVTVTINNAGGIAKCGVYVQSYSWFLGYTQWEPSAGIISYSGTTTDARGNTVFRSFAKVPKINFEVQPLKNYYDETFRMMTEATDTPLVIIASTAFDMMQGYGTLGTWSLPISKVGKKMSVEFKGLA